MPSGRKSLSAIRPLGSSRAAWSAEISALLIRSFTWEWRGCLPADFLQHRPCLPKESTLVPQIQVCWWHRCEPKRRPQAMRRLELSNFNPRDDTGIAFNQSDEFGADTALSLATSVSLGASPKRRYSVCFVSQKMNTFICRNKILILWHPWDPGGPSI